MMNKTIATPATSLIMGLIAIIAIVAVNVISASALHSAVTEQPTVTPTYLQDASSVQSLQPGNGMGLQSTAGATALQPASH